MNRKIIAFVFLVVSLSLLFFSTFTHTNSSSPTKYPQGLNITSSDRILIVAPHPDDETIATAGVIRYCVENSIPVYVVVVTDGGSGQLGVTRYHESLNATGILGLSSDNITFFDYTQGLDSLFNENWDRSINNYGNHTQDVFAYHQNASYDGVSLEKNMESVITDFQPTIIIYPDPNDSNPDHWGTSSFVEYATNKLNYSGQMYTYLVHVSSVWPFPRGYFPDTYLLPPSFLENQNKWVVFSVNYADESIDLSAINSYKSQISSDPTYLQSFIRKNELFIPNQQITVMKNNESMDYIGGSKFPKTIFRDPIGDELIKPPLEVFYSTFSDLNLFDITDVGFEVDNNTTWMSLKTVGGISKTGIYHFRIRSFDDNNKRIDVQVQNGTAEYEILSNNTLSKGQLEVKVKGNGIVIGIPSNLFTNTKYMISVDDMRNYETMRLGQYLDRAGFYTFNLV